MNRYEAADIAKFTAGTEVSITKDHMNKVYYGLVVRIDDADHGVVASVGSTEYSKDDLTGMIALFWQALGNEGHLGSGTPKRNWESDLVTLTGDPLMDTAQAAYALATS